MIRLSASRINTLKDCSLKYYYQYVHKIPQGPKYYFALGTLVHLILEFLLLKKHKSKYDSIVEKQDVYACPVVERLVKKHIKKDYDLIADYEDKIKEFILNGLNFDFFCEGCDELFDPEFAFHVKEERFEIIGFIDKCSSYPKYIRIIDYKTSNYKKDKSSAIFDVQALMYAYVMRKKFGRYPKYIIDFMFLKFGKNQQFRCEYDNLDLDVFEDYLTQVSSFIQSFSFKDRLKTVAKFGFKKNMFCGGLKGDLKKDGSPKHICDMKYPKDYFAIYKDGKLYRTALNREELEKYGLEIHEKHHPGCEVWAKEIERSNV